MFNYMERLFQGDNRHFLYKVCTGLLRFALRLFTLVFALALVTPGGLAVGASHLLAALCILVVIDFHKYTN